MAIGYLANPMRAAVNGNKLLISFDKTPRRAEPFSISKKSQKI